MIISHLSYLSALEKAAYKTEGLDIGLAVHYTRSNVLRNTWLYLMTATDAITAQADSWLMHDIQVHRARHQSRDSARAGRHEKLGLLVEVERVVIKKARLADTSHHS